MAANVLFFLRFSVDSFLTPRNLILSSKILILTESPENSLQSYRSSILENKLLWPFFLIFMTTQSVLIHPTTRRKFYCYDGVI